MVKKVQNWFNSIDKVYVNGMRMFAWGVAAVAILGWGVDMTLKVTNHFENKVKFEQTMTKKMDQLIIGQAINAELSKMQMAKSGGYYFRTDAMGRTVEASNELTALTGLSFNQVKNLGWINFTPSSYQDSLKEKVRFTVESKSDWDMFFPFFVRGMYVPVHSEAKQVEVNDSLIGWVGMITPLVKEPPQIKPYVRRR